MARTKIILIDKAMGTRHTALVFTGLNFEDVEEFVGGDVGNGEEGKLVVASRQGPIVLDDGCVLIKNTIKTIICLPKDETMRRYSRAYPPGPDVEDLLRQT